MTGVRTSEATIAALRRELKQRSDEGAGIAELLDELQKRGSRRFGLRRGGLSREGVEELSRYCWSLQQAKPTLLWGRAREIWGGSSLATTRVGSGSARRSAPKS